MVKINIEEHVSKHLKGINIPPIPDILHIFNCETKKDCPDIGIIKNAIQKDISTSALVLKTVNSSFFGLKVKISSISVAINMLGLNNTINISMGVVLATAFKEQKQAPPHFWESPSNTALVAAALAKRLTNVPADDAYLLGLFHNAGHALLSQKFDGYNVFMEEHINLEDSPITLYEDKTFNLDHASLGYYLASAWGLPKYIKHVILNHHNVSEILDHYPLETDKEHNTILMNNLLCILKMAEHIDKLFWSDDEDHEWARVKDDVLGYLGLSEEDFNDIRLDMLEQLNLTP